MTVLSTLRLECLFGSAPQLDTALLYWAELLPSTAHGRIHAQMHCPFPNKEVTRRKTDSRLTGHHPRQRMPRNASTPIDNLECLFGSAPQLDPALLYWLELITWTHTCTDAAPIFKERRTHERNQFKIDTKREYQLIPFRIPLHPPPRKAIQPAQKTHPHNPSPFPKTPSSTASISHPSTRALPIPQLTTPLHFPAPGRTTPQKPNTKTTTSLRKQKRLDYHVSSQTAPRPWHYFLSGGTRWYQWRGLIDVLAC